MDSHLPAFLFACLFFASGVNLSNCTNITLVNHCNETIWPGINSMFYNLTTYGYELNPGQSVEFTAPWDWYGQIWGRTGCNFSNSGSRNGTCQTGSCGTTLRCTSTVQANSPVTTARFLKTDVLDTYAYGVSIRYGFNLPLTVNPVNGKGKCKVAGCENDLKSYCPPELMLKSSDGKNIACRSACNVFHSDEYCCNGTYTSDTCLATNYSRIFKSACPDAFTSDSMADESSSCTTKNYIVKFCSERNQTRCAFHDNNLVCNKSYGAKAVPQIWSTFVLILAVIFSFINVVFS